MNVDTCMLCDAVTVREGLLHILGGGITDVQRAEYPAPLGISLALRILVHPTELAHPHQFEVLLQDADGEQVTKVDMALGAFRVDIPVGKLAPIALSWD